VVTAALVKKGFQIRVEEGAGVNAKFRDTEYEASGAKVTNQKNVFDSGKK
jgi:NAD(P) transhydrogenase